MKQYKIDIIKKLNSEAEQNKIIELKAVVNSLGIKHLKTQECLEIKNAFLKENPSYKAVRMLDCENDNKSIFCSLTFLDKSLNFEDE